MTPIEPVNILLVDDRPENLLALEAILGNLGETLVRASSGKEALKRALEADFAAILLDVQMPGMSGFEVAKLLRSRRQSKTTPVIFLTGAETAEFPLGEAYTLGAVDYLVKPIRPEVLRAKVAFFVGYFRQTQQLREAERRNAEAALREQQQVWHTTLSSIGDAVVATDADTRVTFLNPEAERLTRWTRSDAVGRSLHDLFHIVHELTRDRIPCPVRQALETGHVIGLTNHTVLIARNGAERPIDHSAAPIRDESGKLLGVVLVFRDITERKEAEEGLRASEERFRFLDTLGEATRFATDPGDIMATTARLLGERLAVARTACADVEADGDRFTIRHDWTAAGVTSTVGVYSLDLFGPRAVADLRGGRTLVLRDVDAELAPDEGADMFNAIGVKAIVCYPLVKGGRLSALMAVHSATPRDWTAAEIALVGEVVERSWAHIERVRDAAALREKDERLKLLIENTKDYAAILSDPAGTIVEWQGGAERITGYSAADAMGKKIDLLFTPEDRAMGRPDLEMAAAARDGRAEDKRWHQRKDGSRFFADGVTTALYDESEKLLGFGKVFKDATGEKRAEESRRQHTEQLRTLAAVSNRLNAVLDLGSVLGVVTEEGRALIGAHQAVTKIVPPSSDAVQSVAFSDEAREGRSSPAPPDRSVIYPVVASGHEAVRLTHEELEAHAAWTEFREVAEEHPAMRGLLAAPIVGRRGETLGVIQLSDKYNGDFTEEDEAILVQLAQMAAVAVENTGLYQALRDADRRKDEFLAMLAHELRNPLAPIQNALAVLDKKGSPDEAAARVRKIIGRQVTHLTRLVDDLLDVARITGGKVVLKKESVELSRVLSQAVETSRPLIDSKGHDLTIEVAKDEQVWLDADAVRLSQVISNLLNNAAKYTDDGGHIRLSAHLEGDDAVIRVTDTGIGLSPEMLPRVFDLFTQVNAGIARTAGGLGIGLTLVRKLIEMHGGSVSVASGGLGKGSEFTVRLPASTERAAVERGARLDDGAREAPKRVLVVDDNPDSLESMAMLLGLCGHVVETAPDGIKAVEVAQAFRPEVMFLDLGLPGRNGYEVARILREDFPKGTLLLVALSGYGQDEDRRRTREAGFDQHLVKPVDPSALERVLNSNHRAEAPRPG